jgi:molecular chaperone GrpE (heat shock protein)
MKQNNNTDIQSKIAELERLLKVFKEKFESGTSDAENFLTMREIERMWSELRGNTDYIYSDMLSELMSNVDESELIRKKKENTKKKESS